MEDVREMLLQPTLELIERLEPLKRSLTFQQQLTLAELKVYVASYEYEKLKRKFD